MMKKTMCILLLTLMILSALPASAAHCKTCNDTGVCIKCEGDGECPSCYNGTGYWSACIICKDTVPGKCRRCYGTRLWVSPTGKVKDCNFCYDGNCKACGGTGLSTTECTICMVTGKCWACGGDGGCADCQWLHPDAEVLRVRLTANLNGKEMTIAEAEELLRKLENECEQCAATGECNSCGGAGYERCPRMCKRNDGCTYCKNGYVDCSICAGSGLCKACGGDGQK